MEEIIKILQDNAPAQSQESLLAVQQYNTATHKVMSTSDRPNKTIYKPVLDANGDQVEIYNVPQTRQSTVPLNRVPISMQKNIVALRKYFMNLKGSVLYADDDQSTLLQEINRVRKDNKYSFKIEEIEIFKSKRHNSLSEYLTDVRADRLDEWQMDEVIKYVKELEKLFRLQQYDKNCKQTD